MLISQLKAKCSTVFLNYCTSNLLFATPKVLLTRPSLLWRYNCDQICVNVKRNLGINISCYPVDISLQWRHNELDGVSNHQPHRCLLNCLFKRRSNKTSKLRTTGLWWRHHVTWNKCHRASWMVGDIDSGNDQVPFQYWATYPTLCGATRPQCVKTMDW